MGKTDIGGAIVGAVAAALPFVGATLSNLVGEIIKYVNDKKKMKENHSSLLEQLPVSLKRLKELATHSDVNEDNEKLTEQVREKVEVFNGRWNGQETRPCNRCLSTWSSSQEPSSNS
jgi:hypothetical protein